MPKKITEKPEKKVETVENKVEEKKEASANPVVKEKVLTPDQVQKRVKSKAEQMKENLESQPKISVFIPLEKGEKKGTGQPFCLNGYRFLVPKGVMTQVPEQVYEMIKERFDVELDVRNRSIEQSGSDVRNALT